MARVTGPLVVEVLLAAFGAAVNPPAVISSIVLVASSRHKAIAFASGWMAGLLLVGSAAKLLGDVTTALSGEPSKVMLTAKLVVGIALVALGVLQWLKHRSPSAERETPAWIRSLDDIAAPRAFLMAAAFAALNPKTVAFVAAGALTISEAPLGVAAGWVVLLLFVLTSSLTVTVPVAFAIIAPQRSAESLVRARRWLSDNGSVLTAGVLGVLGVVLMRSGITGLAQLL